MNIHPDLVDSEKCYRAYNQTFKKDFEFVSVKLSLFSSYVCKIHRNVSECASYKTMKATKRVSLGAFTSVSPQLGPVLSSGKCNSELKGCWSHWSSGSHIVCRGNVQTQVSLFQRADLGFFCFYRKGLTVSSLVRP